jgi:hypothetical protein
MLTSMKLGLATTVAALSIAAVTSAGAAVNPTSAGEIVDQLAVREQSRTPGARQCWITADDNDHGTFGYWGSCSSPNASAAPAPASPALRCRLKRVTNVRKILVTAAPVSSDAAANSLPDCLKGGRRRGRPAFPIRKSSKT